MSQLNLYLPSDTFLQEYECFELLYARCVEGATWMDTYHRPSDRDAEAVLKENGQLCVNQTMGNRGQRSRYQALPPSTERV